MVNKHNVRFWGSEQPHAVRELQRSSEKVNVWSGLLHVCILGPFFFSDKTVTSSAYLDMLEIYAFSQLQDLQPNVLFQQDGAPPHWGLTVRESLFPQRWIGRDGPIAWPPRSPDLTPLDFFFWGYVKYTVYGTQVNSLEELKQNIQTAVATVDVSMLKRSWMKLEYRLDIIRATKGSHVEIS
ncbi:DUF4817 domain-containing protein [Trichonephila clavipes]|nr:DUF4817 domain-containing protein [Trichonephila clavipes]